MTTSFDSFLNFASLKSQQIAAVESLFASDSTTVSCERASGATYTCVVAAILAAIKTDNSLVRLIVGNYNMSPIIARDITDFLNDFNIVRDSYIGFKAHATHILFDNGSVIKVESNDYKLAIFYSLDKNVPPSHQRIIDNTDNQVFIFDNVQIHSLKTLVGPARYIEFISDAKDAAIKLTSINHG
jgi:hypothetical protein